MNANFWQPCTTAVTTDSLRRETYSCSWPNTTLWHNISLWHNTSSLCYVCEKSIQASTSRTQLNKKTEALVAQSVACRKPLRKSADLHICAMLGRETCILPGHGRLCNDGTAAQTCRLCTCCFCRLCWREALRLDTAMPCQHLSRCQAAPLTLQV